MEPAPRVGQGFSPLDEELAVLPGSLTPRQQEYLAHLALWMPFERAAQRLGRLVGVQVSEPTVRRLTERAGAVYEARQTAHSLHSPVDRLRKACGNKQVFSTDGAYISLVGGQWAEVRTLAIGEVQEEPSVHGPTQVKTEQISYFSRMTDAETFGEVAEVEMQRRGVSQAKAVCAVTDGADWIQGVLDYLAPRTVQLAKADSKLTVVDVPSLAAFWYTLNTTKPPFDNKALRQAVTYALDAEAIVKGVYLDVGVAANGPIPPSS